MVQKALGDFIVLIIMTIYFYFPGEKRHPLSQYQKSIFTI